MLSRSWFGYCYIHENHIATFHACDTHSHHTPGTTHTSNTLSGHFNSGGTYNSPIPTVSTAPSIGDLDIMGVINGARPLQLIHPQFESLKIQQSTPFVVRILCHLDYFRMLRREYISRCTYVCMCIYIYIYVYIYMYMCLCVYVYIYIYVLIYIYIYICINKYTYTYNSYLYEYIYIHT